MKEKIIFYNPQEEYGWLANYSYHKINVDDQIYKTVEHYYQSQKFNNHLIKSIIRKSPTPGFSKFIAKILKIIRNPAWDSIKQETMYKGIKSKFIQHNDLLKLLLATDGKEIIENSLNDHYWGIGKSGSGQNIMGKLLMKLRDELIKGELI